MTPHILLLVIAVVLFAVSFFLPFFNTTTDKLQFNTLGLAFFAAAFLF